MKFTAIMMAVLGAIILAFVGIMAMNSQTTTNAMLPEARQNLILPSIAGVGALLVAGLLWAFGGRGYFVSRNPAIRN